MLMQILLVLLTSYLLGSIPFGLVLVRLSTGKDLRTIESGRTGGTNAGRAAGLWAGVATALLDGLKAAIAVFLARWLIPSSVWMQVFAPLLAIIGHNYSIFLYEKTPEGKIRLRGGAGGAPCAGGAFGLWMPSLIIILPVAALILYFIGYASLTTMSIALIASVIFAVRAIWFDAPWEYVVYGLLAELLLMWALRPNIRRLMNGTERIVGRRAHKKNLNDAENQSSSSFSSSS